MATFFVTSGSITNIQNAPDQEQQYYYIDFDQDDPNADPPFPGSAATDVYWGQDDLSFDITFTVQEFEDENGGNTEIWVVTNTTYNGHSYGAGPPDILPPLSNVGDFFSGTTFSSIGDPDQIDSVALDAIESPFVDEYYHIEQTYGANSSGDISNRFTDDASVHLPEGIKIVGTEEKVESSEWSAEPFIEVDVDTFSYVPPEDEVFKQQTNRYQLQELEDIIDEGGEQSEFLGISRWELPDERFIAILHSFTITAEGQTSGNVQEFQYGLYHESHWNFNKAREFADRLQNEEAILKANDTDQTFEEAGNVEPEIPEYELDTVVVTDYFDSEAAEIELEVTPDANTEPAEGELAEEDIESIYDGLIGVPRIPDPDEES